MYSGRGIKILGLGEDWSWILCVNLSSNGREIIASELV